LQSIADDVGGAPADSPGPAGTAPAGVPGGVRGEAGAAPGVPGAAHGDAWPAIPGLQLSVRWTGPPPGSGLGDFCDVFARPAGRWGIVVGAAWADGPVRPAGGPPVSESVSAAVTTARETARAARRPSAVLAAVNRAALDAPPAGPLLLTASYATVLPTRAGALLRICTAGDQVGLIRRARGAVAPAGRAGAPLGLRTDPRLRDARLVLRPGDSLLLVTESVIEALAGSACPRNQPGWSQPGSERLREILAGLDGATAARSADTILRAVRDAVGGRLDLPTIAVVLKVPRRRRGSGVHSGGWPGSGRRAVASRGPGGPRDAG